MEKPLDVIKKTVRILDSVSYENYSERLKWERMREDGLR